ncbi:hypothetical protein M079_0699 [Bacteroides fragilis str. 3996 N(B) 6]|nr:hypothetical protein M079_0699 [Bacteroides fragilis str. 3996 N(B) 6]
MIMAGIIVATEEQIEEIVFRAISKYVFTTDYYSIFYR